MGIKVNLWENPYVSPSSSMYNNIKPYTGSHMVWLGEVPDYTIPEAQKVMLDHHQENHIGIGVSGYKFDEVDGYDFWLWPDHATFPSGHDAVEIRQLYGLIMQDMLDDYFRKQNKRTYSLVRSSYIGASSKKFVIYSDYYGHEGYVTALVNSSLTGTLWVPEVRSAGSYEEWIRRFQLTCFSPMMQLNAWASSKKPWSFPEATNMVRDGAIIPMLTSVSNANQKNSTQLEVRHYGTKENTYLMYNDDGESYDYENGDYSLTKLKVERNKDGELAGNSKSMHKAKFNYSEISWHWMSTQQ